MKGVKFMPFIQINIIKGRSPEMQEKLIKEVTNTVSDVLEAPIESVRVFINEMEPAHWGIAGVSVKKRRENSQRGE
ncbi:2-hydroxymuconate tautomerase [Aneurinibacillus migulanus]|uniref:2-hydroxymuconate tautomerase n=1 Tax=Aneurinibacillus migulanus TaxID=47500 RepID=UPI003908B0E9